MQRLQRNLLKSVSTASSELLFCLLNLLLLFALGVMVVHITMQLHVFLTRHGHMCMEDGHVVLSSTGVLTI